MRRRRHVFLLGIQCKTNGGANVNLTAHMYVMAMGFYNVFANGQAQAAALHIAAAPFGGAEKAFENTGQVFFFNAHSIVAYLY